MVSQDVGEQYCGVFQLRITIYAEGFGNVVKLLFMSIHSPSGNKTLGAMVANVVRFKFCMQLHVI